ncbi:MAG: dihydroneopterin aldolase [Melioribacteraceae bacterium]|jgi:dihydroneopterin aldolase|nr:MAG: dihydroneopterin aldolase [Ignavibacteriales bacterium]WKZ68334.1 MAG: dihydroneopterin aldolase [Melioribacteraceae bacterium]
MSNIIRLKGASFYAYHGALQEEQNIGGKYEVDLEMHTDFSIAAKEDNLKKTIDYTEVYKYVNEIIHQKKYYLIESIASDIADKVLHHFPNVFRVTATVRKKSVPVGGLIDHVEAEVTRENGKS